jgi:drug/metabolite transporter (DMT)-like permease
MDTNIIAAILALAAAFFFGLAKQIQNLGLAYSHPRDGTLIAIASTTLLFWLLSPLYLQFDYWLNPVVILFVFIGILRPIISDNAENFGIKYLGPSLSSAITATSPVFASVLAVIVLGEVLSLGLCVGIAFIILGIVVSSVRGGNFSKTWPIWAIILPLAAAISRATSHTIAKIGLEALPSPGFLLLVNYTVASMAILFVVKVQKRQIPRLTTSSRWFVLAGIANGAALFSITKAVQLGQLVIVIPLAASMPVFTLGLGYFVFKKETINVRTIITTIMVLIGVFMVVRQI